MPHADREPRPQATATRVDLAGLSPRVQCIITLLLRDAPMIDACASGHVAFHYSRNAQRETVKPTITLHPGNTD